MKICVYTIAKNEAKFVERWYNSVKDADYLLIADTGSEDNTLDLVAKYNIECHSIQIIPWRFDNARNEALAFIPNDADVCISLDVDEILVPNWRQLVEKYWTEKTNRLSYNYIWNFSDEGKPLHEFITNKIHGRFSHKWINAVHEALVPIIPEFEAHCLETLIEHHADNSKSRGQYLELLRLDAQEQPNDSRVAYYLAREYYFNGIYLQSWQEFHRYLNLPTSNWKQERCAAMRYIAKIGTIDNNFDYAEEWYMRAIFEDNKSREALIDMASMQLALGNYPGVLYFALKAIKIPREKSCFLQEAYAQDEGPYDLASVAYYYLNDFINSVTYGQIACDYNPSDSRLNTNLVYAKDKL